MVITVATFSVLKRICHNPSEIREWAKRFRQAAICSPS
jgi:hypothetical protein